MIQKNASNVLRYKGTVTIKKTDKNGNVKDIIKCNNGRQGLFNFVLFALAGDYTASYRPFAIMGYSDADNLEGSTPEYANKPCFVAFTPLTHSPILYEKSGDTWIQTATPPVHKVEYSFLIPSAIVSTENEGLRSLKLFNKEAYDRNVAFSGADDTYVCAYLDLGSNIAIERGENLIIYWDMAFLGDTEPVAPQEE